MILTDKELEKEIAGIVNFGTIIPDLLNIIQSYRCKPYYLEYDTYSKNITVNGKVLPDWGKSDGPDIFGIGSKFYCLNNFTGIYGFKIEVYDPEKDLLETVYQGNPGDNAHHIHHNDKYIYYYDTPNLNIHKYSLATGTSYPFHGLTKDGVYSLYINDRENLMINGELYYYEKGKHYKVPIAGKGDIYKLTGSYIYIFQSSSLKVYDITGIKHSGSEIIGIKRYDLPFFSFPLKSKGLSHENYVYLQSENGNEFIMDIKKFINGSDPNELVVKDSIDIYPQNIIFYTENVVFYTTLSGNIYQLYDNKLIPFAKRDNMPHAMVNGLC